MAKQPQAPGFPNQATATIELRGTDIVVVAADGTVDEIHVAAGGTVEFVTPANSPFRWWAILWKEDSPFHDGRGSCGAARGARHPERIGANAHGGAGSRSYRFAIVATDGTTTYFRDPEVIVGPGSGGG